jgi:hypothetical protein
MRSGPEEYEVILARFVREGLTPILVAGQAVNYWASRQDKRHLEISILCSADYICDLLAANGARPALNAIKRIKDIGLSRDGNAVRVKHLIDWGTAVPWAALGAVKDATPSIAHFLEKDAPQWKRKIALPPPANSDSHGASSSRTESPEI